MQVDEHVLELVEQVVDGGVEEADDRVSAGKSQALVDLQHVQEVHEVVGLLEQLQQQVS